MKQEHSHHHKIIKQNHAMLKKLDLSLKKHNRTEKYLRHIIKKSKLGIEEITKQINNSGTAYTPPSTSTSTTPPSTSQPPQPRLTKAPSSTHSHHHKIIKQKAAILKKLDLSLKKHNRIEQYTRHIIKKSKLGIEEITKQINNYEISQRAPLKPAPAPTSTSPPTPTPNPTPPSTSQSTSTPPSTSTSQSTSGLNWCKQNPTEYCGLLVGV